MDTPEERGDGLTPALLAEFEAIANAERRSAGQVLQEAVERYVRERTVSSAPKRSPQEAVKRILERRKSHPLPEGMTIRDLMTFGRA